MQMQTRENVVLHVADVQKNFGGLRALSDVDLQVEEGKTHAIIGPNGAGKSTLLNVIIGRIPPSSGAVIFDGTILTGKAPHEINQLGISRVFQTPEIFADLSVLQNVMTPAFTASSRRPISTVSRTSAGLFSPSLLMRCSRPELAEMTLTLMPVSLVKASNSGWISLVSR